MHFTVLKKSSEPLIEQQQDKIHSRDVYHTARGVAGLLVMGKRYISRSFHLNLSSNCTVSAKHSVNALKGLINDPMETVTSLKTPSNIIWKNFWRYFIGHSTVVVNTLILIVSRVDATETRGKFSLRQQMPFQVPFFFLSLPILEQKHPSCMPLSSETRKLSICMVPVGMASPHDPHGSVFLPVFLKASAS